MKLLRSVDACVDAIIAQVGPHLRVATPLGLGKPNHLLNALYQRVQRDPGLELQIFTALTLSRPTPGHPLERRLMQPLLRRVFGNYPELDYERDRRRDALPTNVRVFEFFLQPGRYLHVGSAQRDYISTNYTYVARDLAARGINVILVQVASDRPPSGDTSAFQLSLSCNADVTLELSELLGPRHKAVRVAQTNGELPFLYGDARLSPDFFDLVVHQPALDYTLFGPPQEAVDDVDARIGLYASTLIRDGGELQIGIGSLGDALAYALRVRHAHNPRYRALLAALELDTRVGDVSSRLGDLAPFEHGLFAATEMFSDAYRHLWEADILKRRVYDDVWLQRLLNAGEIDEQVSERTLRRLWECGAVATHLTVYDLGYLQRWGVLRPAIALTSGRLRLPSGKEVAPDLRDPDTWAALCEEGLGERLQGGAVVHAGFVLGPQALYSWLRELSPADRQLIEMRGITRINQLYGHEAIDRLHRVDARFLNTAMLVTLSGAVVSDGLEDGRVVSGVGGQYNFVAMAHALPEGRAIIQLRSTRRSQGKLVSNIVSNYGHTTVARHQRDLVVTEYGVAELRGKTDEEVIIALLQVADSRFQPELIAAAKRSGKLSASYRLPKAYQRNLPEALSPALAAQRRQGFFERYPFGTDLTAVEQVLVEALRHMQDQKHSRRARLRTGVKAALDAEVSPDLRPYLERMGLSRPSGLRERAYQRMLVVSLNHVLGAR